jgi:hypothetical protein
MDSDKKIGIDVMPFGATLYRVRQKDLPYLERALWELWWGYGGVGGIDR